MASSPAAAIPIKAAPTVWKQPPQSNSVATSPPLAAPPVAAKAAPKPAVVEEPAAAVPAKAVASPAKFNPFAAVSSPAMKRGPVPPPPGQSVPQGVPLSATRAVPPPPPPK